MYHGCEAMHRHRLPVQNAKFLLCIVYGVAAEVRWQLLGVYLHCVVSFTR